jgi:hypothetical protein
MRIALAQLNTIVGDVDGNVTRVLRRTTGRRTSVQTSWCFHELCVSVTRPAILVERGASFASAKAGLERIRAATAAGASGRHRRTAAPVARRNGQGCHQLGGDGRRWAHSPSPRQAAPSHVRRFDEARYFEPAETCEPFDFMGERIGLSICEDAWNDGSSSAGVRTRSILSKCWRRAARA